MSAPGVKGGTGADPTPRGEAAVVPGGPVDLARGTLRGWPRRLLRVVLVLILRPLIGLRLEGLEHVPPAGPLLVVANHLHNSDPILLQIVSPRPLHFMAKRELFGIPVVGWVIRRVGAFPVDRGRADRGALRLAQATLDQGIAVAMFPEGTRSPTRRMRPALPGAGMVALRGGVPILPVAITGSERLPGDRGKGESGDALPPPEPGHRGVRVRFGPTFRLPDQAGPGKLGVQDATRRMMVEIAALLPADYRGAYGEAEVGGAVPSPPVEN